MKRFDVFARLPGGKPFLVESVDDLATAEQHATRFLETFTECLVYSERDRLIVKRIDRVGTNDMSGCLAADTTAHRRFTP